MRNIICGYNILHELALCYVLPVCVEFICVVEHVEFGNITGWSRENSFLWNKIQVFRSVLLEIYISICSFIKSHFTHLRLGKESDLCRSSSQIQDPHSLLCVGIQVTYGKPTEG